ncbi:IS3 family transposase [Brevibacillus laterosporus]|uniref:IS3 family transposase n=1 Tax=Brevibacillus laterosporus TaxID=1465 RepID=UPI000E6D597B|nr:transposase [Brevibacillus laterosporus]NKQ21628.1 transposase [Brevibacillus laterosporus]
MTIALKREEIHVNYKPVYRLMKKLGIRSVAIMCSSSSCSCSTRIFGRIPFSATCNNLHVIP